MKTKQEIKEAFIEEFGVHFTDDYGELKFALAFIEDLLVEQEQEMIEKIKEDIKKEFGDPDWELEYLKNNPKAYDNIDLTEGYYIAIKKIINFLN